MKSKPGLNSMDNSILVWGGGGHGHVVIDLLRSTQAWTVTGVIDSVHPPGAQVMGLPVLGDEGLLSGLRDQGVGRLVVAVGNCAARAAMIRKARNLGFELPSLIHPSAVIYPSAEVGPGCVLCADAIVGAQSRLEEGVIMNTRAVVDHDCILRKCSHMAPGALLCGVVDVGQRSWIGAGSVIRDHINIGEDAMVGLGSVVVKDVPAGSTVYGNPAKERDIADAE